MKERGALAVFALAIALALALRLPRLEIRPLHNDEAVNAIKVAQLWEAGRYAYDPDEYHGPTLHYFTLPFLWLAEARNSFELKDATLRLAPVFFGAGLIPLLLLLRGALGWRALAWTSFLIALSPAMVFYSRYFIHEMLLVFFTALAIAGAWRYVLNPSARWAAVAGCGVGFMFATKETFVLTLAALGLAALATFYSARAELDPAKIGLWRLALSRLNPRHALIATGVIAAIWLVFFSSFFTNFGGLLDSFTTYLPWLKRAGGHSPHIHPWYFYLERLAWFHPPKGPVWTEGFILLLAAVGAAHSFWRKRNPFLRFVAFYTFFLMGIYSVISYKTPWCLLSFFHGAILLAGAGAAAIADEVCGRMTKWKPLPRFLSQAVGLLLVLAGLGHLGWQAWRSSFAMAADRRNPYVYAQTAPDILNLTQRVEGLARIAPAGFDTVIKVIAPESDYWPLPWYLRRFRSVGWYDRPPDDPFAPIVISSAKLNARLDDKSDRKWIMAGYSELRPGVFFELYVELELWKEFVATLPREPEE